MTREHVDDCFHFYPRPPRGGRRVKILNAFVIHGISIHALREEGDHAAVQVPAHAGRFLSTPSARRATRKMRA